MSESTAHRRLAEPESQRRLRQVRSDIVQRTTGALTAASTKSVRTLLDLQTPAAPLGAARAVLEISMKLREVVELEAQIADLEAKVPALEAKGPAGAGRGDPHPVRPAGAAGRGPGPATGEDLVELWLPANPRDPHPPGRYPMPGGAAVLVI